MKINIITLGCSKNTADSEHLAGHLRKAGFDIYFDRERNDCDVIIVNTCGFIGDAKQESVNVLLEQIDVKERGRKERKIIAVGCLVERYRDELKAELPEIDAFYGVHQWDEIVRTLKAEFHDRLEAERMQSTPRHYAYLKISEGCNRSCSYCAIPLIRGKHKSRPIEDIVAEARQIVAGGVKELIVIAQDTTYYGLDLYGERRLGELLNRLANESGAEWIRLHYTYPSSFPDDAIDAIARHSNICKYIDIPLQHISSRLLNSMQRGVDRKETLALLEKFREKIPDVAIRTTLIVGYPGETEADFEELKEFVCNARFNRMGVFAYSPEEGTPAYKLGDPVSDEEKQRRIDELMEIQEQISLQINEQKVGKTFKTIIDRREGDYFVGRTEQDSPEVDDEVLILPHPSIRIGDFVDATITQALEHDLFAIVTDKK
ncbi:MAG: 30S ribosomal protein S12 methylthiotransferase RimO [Bacteroidales bacterium]|nr:30S ribosomal protein S12 methylthiotransferase RimO [Bacteroidales bacterium]